MRLKLKRNLFKAAPAVEEPKFEEPKIEEPKMEEPKFEEPKFEEPQDLGPAVQTYGTVSSGINAFGKKKPEAEEVSSESAETAEAQVADKAVEEPVPEKAKAPVKAAAPQANTSRPGAATEKRPTRQSRNANNDVPHRAFSDNSAEKKAMVASASKTTAKQSGNIQPVTTVDKKRAKKEKTKKESSQT